MLNAFITHQIKINSTGVTSKKEEILICCHVWLCGRQDEDPNTGPVHEGINSNRQLNCWRKTFTLNTTNQTTNKKLATQLRQQENKPGAKN